MSSFVRMVIMERKKIHCSIWLPKTTLGTDREREHKITTEVNIITWGAVGGTHPSELRSSGVGD